MHIFLTWEMTFFRILMLNLKHFVINFDNDVDDLDKCINVDDINLAVKNERL